MPDTDHFDRQESLDPEARETELFAALSGQIAHAKASAPYFSTTLADIDPTAITSRAELARLPVLRKGALIDMQRKNPPFGGVVAQPVAELSRLFTSPGPIYEPEGKRHDYWRLARSLYAAGFRRGLPVGDMTRPRS